jgi:tetratricopeptide (TPR) repeat protein
MAALDDDQPLVRAHAVRSLEPLAQSGDSQAVQRMRILLEDQARDVRITAALALRGVRAPGVKARADVKAYLDHNADQPQGRLQLSMYDLVRGDRRAALAHIEQALRWDGASVPLHQQHAVALSELGRSAEAVNALREAIRLEPESAHLHYLLGLAYNELNEGTQMVAELRRAVELDPALGRAWYNLGLALQAQRESVAALQALDRAQATMLDDPRPPYARATIHYQRGDFDAALAAAEDALRIFPDFPQARSLVQTIRGKPTEDESAGR